MRRICIRVKLSIKIEFELIENVVCFIRSLAVIVKIFAIYDYQWVQLCDSRRSSDRALHCDLRKLVRLVGESRLFVLIRNFFASQMCSLCSINSVPCANPILFLIFNAFTVRTAFRKAFIFLHHPILCHHRQLHPRITSCIQFTLRIFS